MINILLEIEKNLETIIQETELHSMYIDYYPPFVSRIWFQYKEYRVYLHKIEPCYNSLETLYHPHPWQSAIRIIKGKYEMGVGRSETDVTPITSCKLILPTGTLYEMLDEHGWHYVNPIDEPVYSLMVTGVKNNRKMPLEPNKEFRVLTDMEQYDIFVKFAKYYNWDNSYIKFGK